jgi:hypothetical protein
MSMTRRRTFAAASWRTAAAWVATFTIAAAASTAVAQEGPASSPAHASSSAQLAEMERLFWVCDYVATTRGVHAAPVEACSAATEALKNAKFGGDFMALLAWWHGNKTEEHARLSYLSTEPKAPERAGKHATRHTPQR